MSINNKLPISLSYLLLVVAGTLRAEANTGSPIRPLELADELVAPVRLDAPRRVDVDDRRRRYRRPGAPSALDVPQPTGARVDQAPYPQVPLPVPPYPDEGTLRVGSHREPPELPRIERERAGKRELLQALGRSPPGVEERRLSEDSAEDDRPLLLAQHARLVAGGEEARQRHRVGQRVDAARRFRHAPPSVPHELGQIRWVRVPSGRLAGSCRSRFTFEHHCLLRPAGGRLRQLSMDGAAPYSSSLTCSPHVTG